MEDGKFFQLENLANHHVLTSHGTVRGHVSMTDHHSHDEMWYLDPVQDVIRSRANDLVLEVRGEVAIVNKYEPENMAQKWLLDGHHIHDHEDRSVVLGVEGERIIVEHRHEGLNQQWRAIYQPPVMCHIIHPHSGKVLDLYGCSSDPGTKVITYKEMEPFEDNQLWWEDKYGYIHSKLTGYVLDISAEALGEEDEVGDIIMAPSEDNNPNQLWVRLGHKIVNVTDKHECLTIRGHHAHCGSTLYSHKYKHRHTQHWHFRYLVE